MGSWKLWKFSPYTNTNQWLPFFLMALLFVLISTACDEPVPVVMVTATDDQPTYSLPLKWTAIKPLLTKTPTDTPQSLRQVDLEPDDLDGTIIEFWHIWSGATGEVMQTLVDEYNLGNEWGILVVPVYQGTLDQIGSEVVTALHGGKPPDLTVGYMHQILEWDATEEVVDLMPYIGDSFWGYSLDEQADFYPVFWNQGIYESRRLGVPAQGLGQMLFYNHSWAQELGFIAPPASPSQFHEQVCAAAKANLSDENLDNDGTGGWIVSTDYAAMLAWIYANGGDVIKTPVPGLRESIYHFNSPEVEKEFIFLKRLYDDGCAWVAESLYPEAEFAERLGLISVGSIMDIPYQVDAFKQAGNQDEWSVIPFPSSSMNPAIIVYGPSFTMFKSSPEEQLASWLFIKWLYSSENQVRLIPASGSYPLRESTRGFLQSYEKRNPQWGTALDLLPLAYPEPAFRSWNTVRWALADASTQLFRSYFTLEQVPMLVEFLDQTAAELHMGPEESGVFHTSTYTLTPSFTPTRTLIPSLTSTFTRTPWPSATATRTPTTRPTATLTAGKKITPEN